MRDWSLGGGRRWWRQELQVDCRVMWLNYFKDNEETVSGVCRILSTGEPSLPFPRSPQDRRSGGTTPGKFFEISRVAIAVEQLPRCRRRKKCDASTSQSNKFGVSRKRFKPSMPGSTQQLVFGIQLMIHIIQHRQQNDTIQSNQSNEYNGSRPSASISDT